MKKVLAILLAVALVVSFAACGESKTDDETTKVSEFKIGGIGPLTGDYANYGLSVKYGAQIAIDEINAAGGVNGMTLVFDMQDSKGVPENATTAYGKLVDWGMNAGIGTVLSGEMASVTAESAADDMFLVSPSASDDNCLSKSDNAFRICFYDSYQGTAAADYVKASLPGKKVAVFYQSDNSYSVGLYTAFEARCNEIGVEIVTVQSFDSSSDDYSIQIDALVDSQAEVIFIPFYAADAANFLSQAKNGTDAHKFADGVYFFGADGLDGIIGKVEQASTANNVLMLTPFAENSTDPTVVSFVSQYKALTGNIPDQFAADAYDAVYVIAKCIEATGKTSAADIDGNALTEQILNLKYDGITGSMTWLENGNTNKAAMAIIYTDGVGSVFGE